MVPFCINVIAWVSNSLDPDETPSSSASHPDPSCLHMTLWSQSPGLEYKIYADNTGCWLLTSLTQLRSFTCFLKALQYSYFSWGVNDIDYNRTQIKQNMNKVFVNTKSKSSGALWHRIVLPLNSAPREAVVINRNTSGTVMRIIKLNLFPVPVRCR